jgi:hypothetical protein
MKPEDHNKTLGVLHLIYGGLQALLLLFASIFAIPALYIIWNEPGHSAPPLIFILMVFGAVLALSLFFFTPALIAGYGLLKRKSWARTASVVAAALMVLNFPLGTALAIYSLWFFLGSGARLYEDESARFARYALGDAPPLPASEWFDKDREREYAPPQPPDWR